MHILHQNNLRRVAALSAAMCMALSMGACGNNNADFTRKADITRAASTCTSAPETDAAEETEETEETEKTEGSDAAQAVADAAEAEETAAETTAPTETATEITTTAPRKPVGLKRDLLDGRSYSIEKMSHKVYSNSKLEKALDAIDDICNDYGGRISFAYKNVATGATVLYNENVQYGMCSTIKAPFCKELLSEGIDLDDKIKISVIWDGDTGEIADKGFGKTYTARELVRLTIMQSDNSAYYNLINEYGFDGFNRYNAEIGANYELGSSWIFTFCNVTDLLKQYEDIYWYGETSKRGEWLTELMTKTDLESQITAQLKDKYKVAHKYGTDHETDCYHDCAICYAESPFVLIIMTEQTPETKESNKVFHKLAKQFDILNDQIVTE